MVIQGGEPAPAGRRARLAAAVVVVGMSAVVILARWNSARGLASFLEVGDQAVREIQSLLVIAPRGESIARIDLTNDSAKVLLLFSHDCPACRSARPPWGALLATLPDNVAVYGLSVDDPGRLEEGGRFFKDGRVREWSADPAMLRSLGIDRVPMTIVLSGDGRIEAAVVGVLTERGIRVLARAVEHVQ